MAAVSCYGGGGEGRVSPCTSKTGRRKLGFLISQGRAGASNPVQESRPLTLLVNFQLFVVLDLFRHLLLIHAFAGQELDFILIPGHVTW